ncbi:MAG: hypothetical protein QNJ78_06870 [Gammaproteobacteria bacterium]|nr:hypothetical protein [Gammaproteobacteria bacterium]
MTDSTKDAGVIAALLERFEKIRLPKALALKEQVDRGETLTETDISFLSRVLEDTKELQPLLARHPEYEDLVAKAIHLYHEITKKGLENEKQSKG